MRGNSFGKLFSFTSFGESHGKAIGVIIDGMPGGIEFSQDDLQGFLNRRAPGRVEGTTARKEADKAQILSGVFEGKTLGSPICVIVENTNQRSSDYDKLKNEYRPGHADKTYEEKFGIRDHRGGGRSSGRETIARVIAGYFASLIIKEVKVRAVITKLGPFSNSDLSIDTNKSYGDYSFIDPNKSEEIKEYLLKLKENGDSIGGELSIAIDNCPSGLGEPAFDKLKSDLAKAVMSVGACVGFSYGAGSDMALKSGKEISKNSANFGGIEGGISNGERILLHAIFKPTSTVGEKAKEGRHDPCILPRAVVVVESMVLCVIADHFLRQNAYQI